jgi:hypothetical protein
MPRTVPAAFMAAITRDRRSASWLELKPAICTMVGAIVHDCVDTSELLKSLQHHRTLGYYLLCCMLRRVFYLLLER